MKSPQKNAELVRWWDLPAALLLLAALMTAAIRLSATRWAQDLSIVQNIAFLGAIAGLALGQSRFSASVARIFALVYGVFIVPWQIGLTLGDGIQWSARLTSIHNRLLVTVNQLVQQKPVTDNLFFLFLMATLFWTLSVYAGYNLTRYAQPWRAILPAGIAIVIIHAYDSFFTIRTWFLAGYLFFALLLIARLNFLVQHNRWKENGTYLPPYLGLDFIRTALLAAAIVVVFAWTAPALASAVEPAEHVWLQVTRPWSSVRDRMSNAFYSLQASVGFVTDFYGDTMPLGRGNPLSDAAIMTVEAPPQIAAGVRYYWRDRVYDYYDGRNWTSTMSTGESLSPDSSEPKFPEYQGRVTEEFTIQTNQPIQTLHTPSQPVWVSRPVNAKLAVNPDGTVDLSVLKVDSFLRPGDIYKVKASLTAATIEELRQAGTDYPDWIKTRYLQLPDTVTPRTRELAAGIAEGLDNPYDIAQAITTYLRENLTYSDTVPPQPSNQDAVDWVLFDLQQAFCNYYATSEIVMLRSLGIPARLAVGYAQGQQLSRSQAGAIPTVQPGQNIPQEIGSTPDLFTVRHRDAHAWPEVYFPDIGWVEFEPTASQLAILRPQGDLSQTNASEANALSQREEELRNVQSLREELLARGGGPLTLNLAERGIIIPQAAWYVLAALVLALAIYFTRRVRKVRGSPPIAVQLESGLLRVGIQPPAILRRWVHYATLSLLARAYLELNRALKRLGAAPKPNETPAERASVLRRLLPVADKSIQVLLAEYQSATYGPISGNVQAARLAGVEIRNLSFLEIIKRFFSRFQEPPKRRKSIFNP